MRAVVCCVFKIDCVYFPVASCSHPQFFPINFADDIVDQPNTVQGMRVYARLRRVLKLEGTSVNG